LAEDNVIFCMNCGAKNDASNKFCNKCGQPLGTVSDDGVESERETAQATPRQSILDSATSHLNDWTGGQGAIKISWKDFFSQVFKSHSEEDAEKIFDAGTKQTTPTLQEIVNDKVQPWLFSRILVFIILAGILLTVITNITQDAGDQVAVDVVITIAVPISALVLFFESNIYKDISFYRVIKIMLLGGILSLIVTVIMESMMSFEQVSFVVALMVSIIEEVSKLLVAAYFIQKLNINRILNGLLIGAAVGAGFSAFENIKYMFSGGQLATLETALIRTALSISDHTEWCAIVTAALVIVKGSDKLTINNFTDMRFLRFLALIIIVHMCWDWNIFNNVAYIRYAVLILITWVTVFVMIHAGLRELKELQIKYGEKTDNNEN